MPKAAAPRNPGLLSVDELRKRVASGDIDTVIVGFTDHYGRLMGKRFDATFFLDSALRNGAEACNYLLAIDMDNGKTREINVEDTGGLGIGTKIRVVNGNNIERM